MVAARRVFERSGVPQTKGPCAPAAKAEHVAIDGRRIDQVGTMLAFRSRHLRKGKGVLVLAEVSPRSAAMETWRPQVSLNGSKG